MVAERLRALRERMSREGLDYYLVPSADAHQSEYVPACWQRRAFISGFTGSAGDALVGLEGAWLWTDSRYHLQAERQLDPEQFELMRSGRPGVPELADWLAEHARGGVVGVDPRTVSADRGRALERRLTESGAELRPLDDNLVDAIWPDRPPVPVEPVTALDARLAGRSVTEKLAQIREQLRARSCDALLVTTLDAIAWALNLRGRDVDYNPVFISYALVGADDAVLYAERGKLPEAAAAALGAAGVRVEPYQAFGRALRRLEGRVWIDPKRSSLWVARELQEAPATAVEAASPIELLKARKNPVEQAGMREAHVRDGVAVVRFLHWLEGAWRGGGLDELAASERLDAFRAEGERFRGLSFPTISGFGPNGAIVHYRVTRDTTLPIDDSSLYLVDSGAQYLDGTTDVTRTVHLGTPTREEREHYTRVLRGHLALRHTRFPKGTTGAQLDAFARRPLWDAGLDYGHGTGHGVGFYLNVHEGPQGISPRSSVALEPGMVVSNEPGLYLEGRHGVRIENLVLVIETKPADGPDGVPFYGFDDLTLVPYCRALIDAARLEPWEREAVDGYHARVFAALAERLPPSARGWLERATASL